MSSGDVLTQNDQSVSTLSSRLEHLIQTTRRLLRSTWVAIGLGVSVGLFLATLVIVTMLDLTVPLWPAFRFTGLLFIAVPTIWAFVVGVARPLFRRLTQVTVARRIEQELPGIHNRLVSCVDLSNNGSQRHSQAFYHRLIHEAWERVREFQPRRVLDLITLRRSSVFAVLTVVAFLVAFFVFPDRLPTAMARIFQPFADIPPASGVLYDVLIGDQTEPGHCDVLRGEDIDFNVVLIKGEVDPPGGSDPLRLEIYTTDNEGIHKELRYNFPEMESHKTFFKLTGLQDNFSYRVFGGGTWSKKYVVTMLDRPRIVGLQTALHYPTYMRITQPRLGPAQSADVSGPIDSTVEITVDVEGDAFEGEIELLERRNRLVEVPDRSERVWFTDQMPAGTAGHGNWAWDEVQLGQKSHTDAAGVGAHGHGFENAPVGFELLPGESLYADVYLPADQVVETIMLKFHDGKDWEHRAYWGADKIGEGQPGTPGHVHVGDLPSAGKRIRLEVPAIDLGLDGGKIHGVSFAVFGGQAIWGSTGSMPPAHMQITELAVNEAFLMREIQPRDIKLGHPAKWSGKFPLLRDGFYRVVLRNSLKYPNQQMNEGKLTAIPDLPPQVVIERPIQDLVVSEPIRVPVFISAYDDFGIEEITLSLQLPDSGGFRGRPVRKYEKPQQSENAVVMLDLKEEGLKLDQTLRYRVEVRDAKGQSATTLDYTIKIAKDNNAADQQFTQYQDKTETLQDKFELLVQEQAKVEAIADELEAKFGNLTDKIEQAQAAAEAKAEAETKNNPTQPAVPPKPIELNESEKQQLQELKQELAKVTPIEDRALQLAQEVANEMKQVADQSAKLDMLAPEIAEQVQGVQEAFQELALQPMQELRNLVNDGAQPAQADPQLSEIEAQSDQVMETLADLEERIAAVAKAQELSRENVEQAVAQLEEDVLQQNAGIANRELMNLRDSIAKMREDLTELNETQQELIADAQKDLSKPVFDALMEAQGDLDGNVEPVLDDAQELLASEILADVREQAGRPEFKPALAEAMAADAPHEAADAGNEPAGNEPAGNEPAGNEPAGNEPAGNEPAGNEPAGNEPAGNEPAGNEPPGKNLSPDPERHEFQESQLEQAQELQSAEAALAADQEILDDLVKSLSEQLPEASGAELTPEQAAQLQQLLNAKTTREALAMFQRLEQMLTQNGQPQPPGDPNQKPVPAQLPPSAKLAAIGNEAGVVGGVEAILVDLGDFDLKARTVIMKMQPREREELLQGLREEGPEGYRKFIRDYFHRLTKVQTKK